ncbi:MAG: 1-acyl-sn-glycerol-3-phosphate acyltransferase [Bdellovibrionales bacterium]|nr:1-acyl-sn-glycerol-3-phosphate acyltransferase [Bdellovibrionales bacterium]
MKDWNYENEQWIGLPAHLKHLPLFTRHYDMTSVFFRILWGLFLKVMFKTYIRLKVQGDFHALWNKYPRLILISNHASHLDAVSIAAAVPFKYWTHLFMSAAKDYWFKNSVFTFFSKHCLGAIPIDRKDRKGEAIKLCTTLLKTLDRIWLIIFPEGTRSKDGYIQNFKRGVSLFAEKTETPILFLYLEGNSKLMPKGRAIPLPGNLTIHVGPVYDPLPVEELYAAYKTWVLTINPEAYAPEDDNNNSPE